ncbi:MAG: glycine zipper 2TM domain-containing protein [Ramlibacter sp.]
MKKTVLFTALGLAAVAAHAQVQQAPYQQPQPQYQQPYQPSYQPAPSDSGRVISSTPIIQQVAIPRQVCSQQPMVVEGPRTSGAGSVIGAIAGGLLGNTIGHGGGRAAATALGVMGGALVGNSVEANGSPAYAQNVQQCTTQTTYENRTVAYNVTYEYAGRQYTVQMPQDPGPTVRLQVTPVAAGNLEPAYNGGNVTASEGIPIIRSVDVAPAPVVYSAQAVYPAPVVYPSYGYGPYYPPVGVSLNFGYSRGGYGYGHRHWR